MEKAGVALIVEGLSKFQSDIQSANSSLKSLDTSGNFITRMLEGVTGGFAAFGRSMLRVGEIALGVLVRDAFHAVVNGLKEIISATIQAGSEFQALQLRLNRLNFNVSFQATQDFASAMRDGTKATQEQLQWIQRLAATTPYDFQDIANTFTLARSYSFVDKEARELTRDITDFAAGMGLGNTEIERIIVNFGQMVQQGKVTQREMNDLARGSFVPVNDILKQMQENVGLTGKEFDKFRNSTAGVNAFMNAFSQIVAERFTGASQDMARTFKGATDNAKDFVKSIFGLGVVTPVLDVIGGKIADLLESLTSPGTFSAFSLSVKRFGEAFSGLISDLLGGEELDTAGFTNRILQGINRATEWIEENKPKILAFFDDVKRKIGEIWDALRNRDFAGFLDAIGLDQNVIDKILGFRDSIVSTIDTIKAWLDENGPTIETFFSTLGEIVGGVIENLTGIEVGGGLQGFLDGVTGFMTFVIENKGSITEFVTNLVKLWGILQLIGFVLTLILPPILAVVGAFLGFFSLITGIIAVATILLNPLTLLIAAFALIGLGIGGLIGLGVVLIQNWSVLGPELSAIWETVKNSVMDIFNALIEGLLNGWRQLIDNARENLNNLKKEIDNQFKTIADLFSAEKWFAIGRLMIEGIRNGVLDAAGNFLDTLRGIVEEAVELTTSLLGIQSPSRVFEGIGAKLMQGFAVGIEKMSGMAAGAMQAAVTGVTLPAVYASAQMGGMVSTQNNYTNNFNLTVNSSSPREPIVQDYNMLKSLAGA